MLPQTPSHPSSEVTIFFIWQEKMFSPSQEMGHAHTHTHALTRLPSPVGALSLHRLRRTEPHGAGPWGLSRRWAGNGFYLRCWQEGLSGPYVLWEAALWETP